MDLLSASDEIAHRTVHLADGVKLDCGLLLAPVDIALSSYGRLNAEGDNAILVCHALTGDQYAAQPHPLTGKPGWWERMVGPGLPIDTDRYYVLCMNVLGGCMGSTGPRSPRAPQGGLSEGPELSQRPALSQDPELFQGAGVPWGTDFPPITIRDMVRAQRQVIAELGISRLFAVIGGSMGGMQVLQWAASYPELVFAAVPIATAAFHSAQNIAFNEVSRQAIFADPDWRGGRYWADGLTPARGLAVARMMAHITYLSEEALTRKFGRRLRRDPYDASAPLSLFGEMFEVESYLRHQGSSFVRRFDANSYLTVSRAMDYFDIAADYEGDLAAAFSGTRTRFCVISFSSDWLFPTPQSRAVARALNRAAANVSFVEIDTDKGHDAFLLDEPALDRTISGFLLGAAEHARLT